MKKIFLLITICFIFIQVNVAQTIVWTGTTSTDFFDASNWVGGVGYTGGEDILFNSGSNNCDITTADMAVATFSVLSGYTGAIDFGARDHFIDNAFVVNSGTVIGSSSSLSMLGAGTFQLGSSGSYSTNGGAVGLSFSPGQSFSFSGNIVLNSLDLNTSSNGSQRNVDFGTNLSVDDIAVNSLSSTNRPISFQGTIHIKNSLTLNGTSTTALTNNNATFIFDGASATITGPAAALRMPLPNVEINTSGNLDMSGHINVNGNWTGTQGALTAGISTVNMYGSSATISGTAAAFDNLVLQTGASVTFPSSAEVLINRAFANGGTVSFPTTCTLGLNGSTTQNITGNGFTVNGIHAYSGGRTINLSTPISVNDYIDIDGASVVLASGGNLTLKSTNALTARIGTLDASSSITGNVTVETVIPGGSTGWATLGVRGVQGQTIANWDTWTSISSPNGIPMTCIGCVLTPSDVPTGWFKSIQGWNEGTSYGYDSTVTASTAMNPGVGFWVYVGDGFSSTNDLKVINTGSLNFGQVVVNVTSGAQSGFNLVANPYPSPISWDQVMLDFGNSSDVSDAIYAFNANSGIYTSYVGGAASSPAPNGIDDVIAGGQGFYIESLFGGNLTFEESMKVSNNTSANPIIRETASNAGKLFRLKLAGANDADYAAIRIHGNATIDFDKKYDAKKLFQSPGYSGYPGAYDKYTTISSKDGTDLDYSIQSLPPLVNSATIPILARVSATGSYTISAQDFKDFAMCVGLIDKLDNTYHDLRLSPYVCNISDTTFSPRFELVLCKDESASTGISQATESSSTILISQNEQGVVVKTIFDKNTKATISAFNIVGQKLMNDITVTGTATQTQLPIELHNQVVIIKVTTDSEIVTKKVVMH